MARIDILHKDFKAAPYWWEAYKPAPGPLADIPRKARVVIVGAGYAGLSCAIELADAGIDSVVLEAADLGSGASTRSGGGVSGGVNIGKSFRPQHGDGPRGREGAFSIGLGRILPHRSADRA